MAKSRISNRVGDGLEIGDTSTRGTKQRGRKRIRPKTEESQKLTMILYPREIFVIDDIIAKAKKKSGATVVLRRAAIIRALINWLHTSGPDITDAKDEDGILAILQDFSNDKLRK